MPFKFEAGFMGFITRLRANLLHEEIEHLVQAFSGYDRYVPYHPLEPTPGTQSLGYPMHFLTMQTVLSVHTPTSLLLQLRFVPCVPLFLLEVVLSP